VYLITVLEFIHLRDPTLLCRPHLSVASACTTPVPPIPAALLLRIQATMEASERPTRNSVVFDTGITEVVENAARGPPPPPPLPTAEQLLQQQLAAESAPEMPLTDA
jgi:hypothetical protein